MANKKPAEEQAQVITSATTQQITDMLVKLNQDHPDFMKSTTKVKQHKQDIKQVLNVSDKVYLSLLKAYKDMQIIKAKEDRDNDKKYLRDFAHTCKVVLQDMQQDSKYSTYLRDIIREYKDNIMQFVYDWSKEWDGTKFLTIHTFYNVEECIIVKRYGEDANLTYSKVYSLISKCIDNLFVSRKSGIKDKEFALSKYSDGYITGVYKFGAIDEKSGRPKRGEEVTDVKDYMLKDLVDWNTFINNQ